MSQVIANVNERSTIKFSIDITDDNGDPVVPTAFKWTLTQTDGTVVNGRLDEPETPATTVVVTLAGDDLQIFDETEEREFRLLTIETDQGLAAEPLTDEVRFAIENLKNITT